MSYEEAQDEGHTEGFTKETLKTMIDLAKTSGGSSSSRSRRSKSVKNADTVDDTDTSGGGSTALTLNEEEVCNNLGGKWDAEAEACRVEFELSIG